MRTTQSLSITLPLEMAQMVESKVKSGEYATESEVIRDGSRSRNTWRAFRFSSAICWSWSIDGQPDRKWYRLL